MNEKTIRIGTRYYTVREDGQIIREPFEFVLWHGARAIKRRMILKPYITLSGYLRVCLQKKMYFVHRIVWMAFNGDVGDGLFLDHINGNRQDNRIDNLRVVTKRENAMNRKGANSNSKSGIRGVYFHKRCNRWCFSVCGKQKIWTESKEKAVSASVEFHGL